MPYEGEIAVDGNQKRFTILCPRCDYRPTHIERWICEPGCGAYWNTFWTRGLCPGCGKLWNITQCPECGHISPHRHWYRTPASHETEPQAREALESR